MGFQKDFLKSIFTYGSYTYISQIVEFFSTVIISRFIFPEEYGFVAVIRIFTEFIAIFSQSGFSHSIIRSDYGPKFWRLVSNLTIWIGIFFFILICLFSYPISLFFDQSIMIIPIIVAGLQFITVNINIVPFAILSKKLDFNSIGKIRLSASLFRVGLMIPMAITGFSYWTLIIPFVLSPLLEHYMLRRKLKFGFHFSSLYWAIFGFKKIQSLVKNISGLNLINYWTRNIDNLLIGKFYSNHDLGIYNRAYRFINLVKKLITSIFGVVLYPSLKKLKSQNKDYKKEYCDILKFIGLANFIPGLILIIVPNELVMLLWGENWIGVAQFLPYFGILILNQPMISTISELFILEHEEKKLFLIGSITSVIIILALASGAFFSIMHIVQFYTFTYMAIVLPINLIYGYIRILKFKRLQISLLWIPRIILGLVLFANFYLGYNYELYLLFIYLSFIILENIKKINSLFRSLQKRLKKQHSGNS